eukprot:TRINITY_DN1109_c0_g1_i1.p1 TRINITY_DN1109_c0_g1~~TRINITY_DN1109_c0_g1_i1.p1  ORF type:complete len:251 (+),score=43.23 TRINITY_DN1109_c0_g1_i1:161-913(+)
MSAAMNQVSQDQFAGLYSDVLMDVVQTAAAASQSSDTIEFSAYFESARTAFSSSSSRKVMPLFTAKEAPKIPLKEYVKRIVKHINCSIETQVMSLIYLDRVCALFPKQFSINDRNVHRLCLTTLMLAAKFHDDAYYSNKFYSRVGGISVHEMNQLEAQFLVTVEFNLNIGESDYYTYHGSLMKRWADSEAKKAAVLSEKAQLSEIANELKADAKKAQSMEVVTLTAQEPSSHNQLIDRHIQKAQSSSRAG